MSTYFQRNAAYVRIGLACNNAQPVRIFVRPRCLDASEENVSMRYLIDEYDCFSFLGIRDIYISIIGLK